MKLLTPNGACSSDGFPRCSVAPPHPVPSEHEAKEHPHFPRKPTGAFCKGRDTMPKSQLSQRVRGCPPALGTQERLAKCTFSPS